MHPRLRAVRRRDVRERDGVHGRLGGRGCARARARRRRGASPELHDAVHGLADAGNARGASADARTLPAASSSGANPVQSTLAGTFRDVVAAEIDEYRRLYGTEPQRIDGHHHMHLCANVLQGGLLPAGTVVRRNFSVSAG